MIDPLDKESADGRILFMYLGGVVVWNGIAKRLAAKEGPPQGGMAELFAEAALDPGANGERGLVAARHLHAVAAFADAQDSGADIEASLQAAQDQDGRLQRALNALTAWLWPKTPKPTKGQADEGR